MFSIPIHWTGILLFVKIVLWLHTSSTYIPLNSVGINFYILISCRCQGIPYTMFSILIHCTGILLFIKIVLWLHTSSTYIPLNSVGINFYILISCRFQGIPYTMFSILIHCTGILLFIKIVLWLHTSSTYIPLNSVGISFYILISCRCQGIPYIMFSILIHCTGI